MTATAAPVRNETAKGVTLLFAQVLPVMAIVSLFPAIPKLMQQFGDVEHAALLVPMILTVPSLMVAIFAPIAGAIADRFGRKTSFQLGMFLYVAMGIVPVFTADIFVIVASRAVLGIAEAMAVTVSSALIGDYFGENRRKWTTRVGMVISPAGTMLLVAGGFLAEWDWRGPFFIYLLAIPGFVLALLYIEEPEQHLRSEAERIALPFPWREATTIGSLTVVASLLYYVEPLNIARVFAEIGLTNSGLAGIAQAVTSLGFIAGAYFYGRTAQRSIGEHMAVQFLLMGIGLIVIGLSSTLAGVGIGATIQQIGAGLTIPSLLAWGQARLPYEQRARGMGIWTTSFFAGTFLCPPMVTFGETITGGLMPAMILFGAICLIAAIIAAVVARSQPRLSGTTAN
ncbi:MFS transporter [Croceicoccus sediminis]|uniref:MFS transporter n=1 Tax=Croceicoccus sediminis TaxID=2571150 RepID=UPI0011822BAD|nr:MFS transporter [Croceicoccus sediminis]